jgi:hypothetical protein
MTLGTRVVRGTGIAIVTGKCVVGMDAQTRRARVRCAQIAIVALAVGGAFMAAGDNGTDALTGAADVSVRTGMTIITWAGVVEMPTAGSRIARIVRAGVAVIAVRWRPANALPAGTGIGCRAGVAVVARFGIVGMHAPDGRIAEIIGAKISIVAIRRCTSDTNPLSAGVLRRAGIPIIAGTRVGNVLASRYRVA